jgi:hypothetical protein
MGIGIGRKSSVGVSAMPVPAHRVQRSTRPRRWRAASAVLGAAVLALVSLPAFAADNISPDGDIASGGPNASFSGSSCTGSIAGQLTVSYNGNSDGGHFAQGESLSVDFTTVPAGVHITPGAIPNVPTDWGTDEQANFDIPFSTTVDAGSAGGKVEVTVTGNLSGNAAGDGAGGKPNFQVSVNCPVSQPSSHAPVVGTDAGNTSGDEGSQQTNSGSFTDADGNNTLTITGSGAGTVTDNGNGNWSWTYTPADNGTGTVTVTASDGTSTAVDTFGWTANNVVPTVAQPSFSSTSVDCRNAATLSGVSFSDPGVNDNPWAVSIDWGDGSSDTTFNASTQGAQTPNPTHAYATPGSYTATVTVTDKDGGEGSNTSSNQVIVNQVYTTDFLPPFDDSTPSGLIVNQMKNGRVVPVKATIYDVCAQGYVTSPASVTIGVKKTNVSGSPTPDAVESYSDAGASSNNTDLFRWNADSTSPTGGFWIYNLDSKGLALVTNSYYRVDIYVGGVQATKTNWGVLQPVK